jgi:hypothetical protein
MHAAFLILLFHLFDSFMILLLIILFPLSLHGLSELLLFMAVSDMFALLSFGFCLFYF